MLDRPQEIVGGGVPATLLPIRADVNGGATRHRARRGTAGDFREIDRSDPGKPLPGTLNWGEWK